MYSIKIAAKLVKIKQLYKKAEEQLSNFIVLSTYYLTFRLGYSLDGFSQLFFAHHATRLTVSLA